MTFSKSSEGELTHVSFTSTLNTYSQLAHCLRPVTQRPTSLQKHTKHQTILKRPRPQRLLILIVILHCPLQNLIRPIHQINKSLTDSRLPNLHEEQNPIFYEVESTKIYFGWRCPTVHCVFLNGEE